MGTALVQGTIQAGAVNSADVFCADHFAEATQAASEKMNAIACQSNSEVVAKADVVLLCTKPAQIPDVLAEVADSIHANTLFISVAAGVKIQAMEAASPAGTRIVRCMPNTPALIGKGAGAYAAGSQATADDLEIAHRILGSVGEAIEVPENLLDAVTGLSGSGPAYTYTFIESLADEAIEQGIEPDQAVKLAALTVLGGAAMVLETEFTPAELRQHVSSPNGTTVAGLQAMGEAGFVEASRAAVKAATARSIELGKA